MHKVKLALYIRSYDQAGYVSSYQTYIFLYLYMILKRERQHKWDNKMFYYEYTYIKTHM